MDNKRKDTIKHKMNKAVVSHMRGTPQTVCAICDGETDDVLEMPLNQYDKLGGEVISSSVITIKRCSSHQQEISDAYVGPVMV